MPTSNWRSPTRLIPIGMLVSNVGNGMYLLAASVYMYHHFGGPSTFAWLVVLQSIAVVMTQVLASVAADAGYAKALASAAEFVRGVLVLVGGVAASFGMPLALFAVGLGLAFVQPFYRTSVFALGPVIARGDGLARYNARTATYQQVGQFLGAAMAGGLMLVWDLLPIYLNGVSYIVSGLMISMSCIPGQSSRVPLGVVVGSFRPAAVSRSWAAGIAELWRTQTTLRLSVLCAIDFLVIGWINVAYAPILAQYGVSRLWISWWDTAFAVGAILGANLVGRVHILRRSLMVLPVVLILEAASVVGIGHFSPGLTIVIMVAIGTVNAVSVSLFTYFIQMSARAEMAGRSSGVRQLSIAVLSLIGLPLLTGAAGFDVGVSSAILALVVVLFAVVSAVALRGRRVVINEVGS